MQANLREADPQPRTAVDQRVKAEPSGDPLGPTAVGTNQKMSGLVDYMPQGGVEQRRVHLA